VNNNMTAPPLANDAIIGRLAHIERQLHRTRLLAAGAIGAIALVSLAAFKSSAQKTHFDEIDVERINVVERDGRVRMVIANRERSPGPLFKGKPFGYPGGTRAGLIFYDDEGTEDGGLIFRGKTENGKYSAAGHLSFDQYGNDQVINLEYQDENGTRRQGLQIADRPAMSIMEVIARRDTIRRMPDGPAKAAAQAKWVADQGGAPFGALRLYVGRDTTKAALVDLKDRLGRSRLRLLVDSLGAARIEFLDTAGHVTHRLPD
jgi:hypothetical protein